MPAIADRCRTGKQYDKRVKLSQEQREEIHLNIEGLSQRALATKYKVSRRLIGFILFPEKAKRNLELRALRGGSKIYYDKDSHTKAMNAHRAYKKELLIEGKISRKD